MTTPCPHALVNEAYAQLDGIIGFCAQIDGPFDWLTGWQLYCLLEPVNQRLSLAEKLLSDKYPIKQ